MTQLVAGGERTVVVGVKLDSPSRELMTWTLVKVARSGDRVIALHVLNDNEIVDRDGKSSLFSLVKAFDSILEVYEGFCNLKQIDLKLKICRGSLVKKVIVQEAKSYDAAVVVLGTAQTQHTIRSSASVAKYCARNLPKDCSVLAVSNGKIAFHRESSSGLSIITTAESENHCRSSLVNALLGSFNKGTKVVSEGHPPNLISTQEFDLALADQGFDALTDGWSCSVCSPDLINHDSSCAGSSEQRSDNEDNKEKCMAVVPVLKPESESISTSKESSEDKLGWPLLRQAVLENKSASYNFQQRPIWLQNQQFSTADDVTQDSTDRSELDGETGALVLVRNDKVSISSSLDHAPKTLTSELKGLHEDSGTCRLFTFEELMLATSNFAAGNMIGKGGSSQVYRGRLPEDKEIAVKILKPSEDAVQEFILEIEILTTLHHKNVISLFGFCFEDNHLLLVYDFISRGNLEENLHGDKKDSTSFTWNDRYRVGIGVADALEYLHSREGEPIIHRDVKSSNILLSADFMPQLSDFGLAKRASTTSTHITCSDVSGTFGYLAPEYFMYGKVNAKIDVYAYGVVLLELLSGRRPISNDCPKGEESLVMWAKPILHSDKFAKLLDPNLGSSFDLEQVERMVLAASLCIRRAPQARPKMNLVLKILQGDAEALKWARMQVSPAEQRPQNDSTLEGIDPLEDETFPQQQRNLQSHLSLALLGVEEDLLSVSSIEQSISLEDYLRGRWSRTSSLD